MKDNQLEVGDKLIYSNHNQHQVFTIDRVTAARAFCGSYCFKREVTPSWRGLHLSEIGRAKWSMYRFSLYSEEAWLPLVAEAKKLEARRTLERLLDMLTRSVLEQASIEAITELTHDVQHFLNPVQEGASHE